MAGGHGPEDLRNPPPPRVRARRRSETTGGLRTRGVRWGAGAGATVSRVAVETTRGTTRRVKMAKDLDELLDEVETKFCRLEPLRLGERPNGGGGTARGGDRNGAEDEEDLRLTRAGGRFWCSRAPGPTPPSAALLSRLRPRSWASLTALT